MGPISLTVWHAAKAVRPTKPNILYLDELQTIAALPVDTEEILAKAGSFGLGMVQANQGAYQLSGEVYSAITTNPKTKVSTSKLGMQLMPGAMPTTLAVAWNAKTSARFSSTRP